MITNSLLARTRAFLDNCFRDVHADDLAHHRVEQLRDGRLAVCLFVVPEYINMMYSIELSCEPYTMSHADTPWQHIVAGPAEARAVHGRVVELMRTVLSAPTQRVACTITALPETAIWSPDDGYALPALTPSEAAMRQPMHAIYEAWEQGHPTASDGQLLLAINDAYRLLDVPVARRVVNCE